MGIVVVIFRRVVPEMRLLFEPEHGNATFQSNTAISCGQFFSCARFVMNIFFLCEDQQLRKRCANAIDWFDSNLFLR